ncbi:hypothetical protein FRC0497_00896 [Corynebacterium diphtheriae]|nr:hypothetical protein FRC0497_00896 [Corynebacterium diphtheriae]
MSVVSYGFNRSSSGSIELEDYSVTINGLLVGEKDNHWSQHANVQVNVQLNVDYPRVLRECRLTESQSEISASIIWHSSRTNLHKSGGTIQLVDGQNFLTANVPSTETGGELKLSVVVFLKGNYALSESSLAPSNFGSKLWESNFKVLLEGTGPMFPVSAIDFAKANFEFKKAMWYLEIQPYLESHISRCVRLYLNSGHPAIENFLKETSTPESEAIGKQLQFDTMHQLLTFAYSQDFEQWQEFAKEDGTFAAALNQLHDRYFPNQPPETVIDLFKTDPGRITAILQAQLLGGK